MLLEGKKWQRSKINYLILKVQKIVTLRRDFRSRKYVKLILKVRGGDHHWNSGTSFSWTPEEPG